MIAGSLRIRVDEKQELLEERNVTKRLRRLSEILARELEVMELGSKIQSEVQNEMDKTQREYFLREQLKAIQQELGEEDETQAEINELREQMDEAEPARERPQAGRARAVAAREAAAGGGRARRDPDLPRMDRLPALEQEHRGQPRHPPRAQDARRRPLRHREGQGKDPGPPRGAEAEARRAGLDPVVRRSSRRRQDLAREVDRQGPRAQVRADLGGRRARRGRDPRSPPHLHRRVAGHDHPRAARRGVEQPRVHDRRDRQDGHRLPRRPGERDARGARPRAEPLLPRSLPRPAVRPLEGDVHHHGEHPRGHSRPSARPHGGDPARRLHRRGEARDRPPLPDPAPDRAQRADAGAGGDQGRGDRHRDPRVHARGRRPQPRARARNAVPQGGARVRRGQGEAQGDRHARQGARDAGQAALLLRVAGCARRSRASPQASHGLRSAARCCSSRRPSTRARAS